MGEKQKKTNLQGKLGFTRSDIQAFLVILATSGKVFGHISGFGRFLHICSACQLFTAKCNENILGLSFVI